MPQIDEPISAAPNAASQAKKPKPATTAEKPPRAVYSFTVDTGSCRILTVERVESDGSRHALSAEDKAKLAQSPPAIAVRTLVEQAFEAGIDYVLGSEGGPQTIESKEEGELSDLVLQTLIEGSKARDLVRSDTVERSVISTLILHAAA